MRKCADDGEGFSVLSERQAQPAIVVTYDGHDMAQIDYRAAVDLPQVIGPGWAGNSRRIMRISDSPSAVSNWKHCEHAHSGEQSS